MSTESNNGINCSRRDMLKVAGLGAAAMTIPGLARNAGAASMTHTKQEVIDTDVLVVGGGFAGTFAAVKAKEQGVDVTMAIKGTVGGSEMTPWGDAFHADGEYLSNPDHLNLHIDNFSRAYKDLKALGAVKNRAVAFRKKVNDIGINLLERVRITDLLLDGSRVTGAVVHPFEEDKMITIKAKSVVLATEAGGYKPNGFPLSSLTFDGAAMVYKHGIPLSAPQAMP